MNETVDRLRHDLLRAGVPAEIVADLTPLYECALAQRTHQIWVKFYLAIFAALRDLVGTPPRKCSEGAIREELTYALA
jgi:hypothetical protein